MISVIGAFAVGLLRTSTHCDIDSEVLYRLHGNGFLPALDLWMLATHANIVCIPDRGTSVRMPFLVPVRASFPQGLGKSFNFLCVV